MKRKSQCCVTWCRSELTGEVLFTTLWNGLEYRLDDAHYLKHASWLSEW